MADNKSGATISAEDLAAAFQLGMTAALDAAKGPKPFDYAEYAQQPDVKDLMTGGQHRLKQPVYQNGFLVNLRGCSDATIERLNGLKPGRYLGGRVEVTVKGDPPNESFHINYPWATVDERMRNYGMFSSFSDLVAKIDQEARA